MKYIILLLAAIGCQSHQIELTTDQQLQMCKESCSETYVKEWIANPSWIHCLCGDKIQSEVRPSYADLENDFYQCHAELRECHVDAVECVTNCCGLRDN